MMAKYIDIVEAQSMIVIFSPRRQQQQLDAVKSKTSRRFVTRIDSFHMAGRVFINISQPVGNLTPSRPTTDHIRPDCLRV